MSLLYQLFIAYTILIMLVEAKTHSLIVGLNSALQRRVFFSASAPLRAGEVNRASRSETGVGGKGQDVALALNCLPMKLESRVSLLQFVGLGSEGDELLKNLRSLPLPQMTDQSDCNAISPTLLTVRSKGTCRICSTLIDADGRSTEIVEPSGSVTPEEVERLIELSKQWSVDAGDSLASRSIAVMGSMPPGCSNDLYAQILRETAEKKTLVLLDTVVGLSPALLACEAISCQTLVKINLDELRRLSGSSGEDFDILAMVHRILGETDAHGSKGCVYWGITDGARPAYFVSSARDKFASLRMSQAITVLNPIGAGDAVSAGTLSHWTDSLGLKKELRGSTTLSSLLSYPADSSQGLGEDDKKVLEAFCWGLSCGAASCMTDVNSFFDFRRAVDLFHSIDVSIHS